MQIIDRGKFFDKSLGSDYHNKLLKNQNERALT